LLIVHNVELDVMSGIELDVEGGDEQEGG